MGQNEIEHVETPEEERRQESKRSMWFRRALTVWIVIFTPVVIDSVRSNRENTSQVSKLVRQSVTLSKQNRERITDIQQSRVESCKSTYESFHSVFDPFFPPPGQRTAKQRSDLKKFNKIISDKVKQCRAQVKPPADRKK